MKETRGSNDGHLVSLLTTVLHSVQVVARSQDSADRIGSNDNLKDRQSNLVT